MNGPIFLNSDNFAWDFGMVIFRWSSHLRLFDNMTSSAFIKVHVAKVNSRGKLAGLVGKDNKRNYE